MTGELTFLDSNVLVYALDTAEPVKQAQAQELLVAAPEGGYVISAQVLGEVFSVATRKLGLSAVDALEAVRRLEPLSATAIDDELVFAAIKLCAEKSVSYWDALIVSAAARLRCEVLLSEDLNDGEVISGVRVVNPF